MSKFAKMKNRGLLAVVLVLVLSMLVACSSNGGTPATNSGNGGSGGTSGNTPTSGSQGAADEGPTPVEIVLPGLKSNVSYPDGMDDNNNYYVDLIEKNANVDMKLISYPDEANAYQERINILMSSNDLPDMMVVIDQQWFINYVNQKALKPLNDAIDKYGANLKAIIPQEAWDEVSVDGNIYAIPYLNDTQATQRMYVRKDWLDRLDLKEPKTLEEYKEVMRAFVERDPDNNNANDTIGLLMGTNLDRSLPFFGAFGVPFLRDHVTEGTLQWVERDGKLVSSSVLPETKEALRYLAELYDEGLIDTEWALNKFTNLNEKIAGGKVGLFSARWMDTRSPIAASIQNDPSAVWIPLEYPVGPEGKSGVPINAPIRQYNVVPVTSNNEDAVVRMLDYMIGDGFMEIKFGQKDVVWHMDGDKLIIDEEESTKQNYRQLVTLVQTNDIEIHGKRFDGLGMEFRLTENIKASLDAGLQSAFTGIPTPAMGKHTQKLLRLENETFTQMIMGVLPIDQFDQFVENWYKTGGDEITQEVNAWYTSTR